MIKKSDNTEGRSLTETIENMEKEVIVDALKKNAGQQRNTAKELGITERILGYKIKKYKILPKYL